MVDTYVGLQISEPRPYPVAAKVYAIQIHNNAGQAVISIGYDGSVEYGEAFTAATAARLFWGAVADVIKGTK